MAGHTQVDNSDLLRKLAVRQRALSLLGGRVRRVFEGCAGTGNMTRYWSQVAGHVDSVDINAGKLSSISLPNVSVHAGEYKAFLALSARAEMIDMDAYNYQFADTQALLRASQTQRKCVVFTTCSKLSDLLDQVYACNPAAFYIDNLDLHIQRPDRTYTRYGFMYWPEVRHGEL